MEIKLEVTKEILLEVRMLKERRVETEVERLETGGITLLNRMLTGRS